MGCRLLLLLLLAGCGGGGGTSTDPHTQDAAAGGAPAAAVPAGLAQPPVVPGSDGASLPRQPLKLPFKRVVPDDIDVVDIDALRADLNNPDPERRMMAIDELVYAGELGPDELRGLLQDASPMVRQAAIEALAEDGAVNLDLLGAVLGDPDPDIREMALYMIYETAGDDAIGLLEQASADSSEAVREAASDLLCHIDPARCPEDDD